MKIAILGAGAAGCFAAANLPFSGDNEVVIFEKSAKAMQKVKVSGGGRCNVTHACFDIGTLTEHYPRGKNFLKKTFHHFGPKDTIDWFEKRGVALKTENDGRVFPITDNAQSIIDCIWDNMVRNKVQLYFHKQVTGISPYKEQYRISFADKTEYIADKILITTGGFPKIEQYNWINALPQATEAPVPSLFTFNAPKDPITSLMGISCNATVKIAGTKIKESGPLLITHWGFSGPAILRCSAWGARILHEKNYTFTLLINWLQDTSDEILRQNFIQLRQQAGKQIIQGKPPFALPKRLWEYLTKKSGINDTTRWADLNAKQQNLLSEHLLRDAYAIQGKTIFKEEFVTCGGVNLKDIDPQTMQSRIHKGIFYAGEITDVDGITGGFNFQNAWTGGWIAAQSIVNL